MGGFKDLCYKQQSLEWALRLRDHVKFRKVPLTALFVTDSCQLSEVELTQEHLLKIKINQTEDVSMLENKISILPLLAPLLTTYSRFL